MKHDQLLVIAPLGSFSGRTRLFKLATIAHKNGFPVSLWGWSRTESDVKEPLLDFELQQKSILLRGQPSGVWVRLYYPVWMFVVFIALLFRRRPIKVYCLGLETAIAAWAVSFIRKTDYIFDDADRLVMIIKLPKLIKWPLVAIERRVSARSNVHIIPGIGRYDYQTEKQFILKNTPSQMDVKKAMSAPLPNKSSRLVVYVNGWMGQTRGLPIMLKIAQHFKGSSNISFLGAGRLDGAASVEFSKLPNVDWKGNVSSTEALLLYRQSDLIVTLYDPAIEINRYAESNKWGDALFMGVPVLVNEEVKTADFLKAAGASFQFPYNNSNKAIEILERLIENIKELEDSRLAIQTLREQFDYFDTGIEKIFFKENKEYPFAT